MVPYKDTVGIKALREFLAKAEKENSGSLKLDENTIIYIQSYILGSEIEKGE